MRQHPATTSAATAAALLLTILAAYEPPAHEPYAQERHLPPSVTSAVVKAAPAPVTRSIHIQRATHTAHRPVMLVGISY